MGYSMEKRVSAIVRLARWRLPAGDHANRSSPERKTWGQSPGGTVPRRFSTPHVGKSSGGSMLNLGHALLPALATLALLAAAAARGDEPAGLPSPPPLGADPRAQNGRGEAEPAARAKRAHCPRRRSMAGRAATWHSIASGPNRCSGSTSICQRAKFPVVDVHFHPRVRFHENPQMLDDFVKVMDRQNIAVCVSLDGQMGDSSSSTPLSVGQVPRSVRDLRQRRLARRRSGRPAGHLGLPAPRFRPPMARQLAETKAAGACGLKVFKDFGLVYRNPDGSRIRIDDPRWDPIWAACGELGMPVLDSRGRSGRFLPADRRDQRTLGRAAPASRLEFCRAGSPLARALLDALLTIVRRHRQNDLHRRPCRQQCRRPGGGGRVARRASEFVCRHRRADCRAGPAARDGS